ncbi:hypothetical protein VC83_08608 [Pseudogymnoascus destructans]|uniref:Rab-GAP TBC domain-containing protein n=2 Tax=Pseudogymnoascus destructans TaxID=655981 RepID=L8G145_PSED2|nr:uncharacterized protein VC83_08608 [Pseudogymnoascus destructans]ELR06438.1 hypothetical protein GMDG_07963 [Pseudogymnoascus destructans 20631-21]OAF54828.2 hypothetical protein VC83_08608 [Pseudogymnoascus destructans]
MPCAMAPDITGSTQARPTTASGLLPFLRRKAKAVPCEEMAQDRPPTAATTTAPNAIVSPENDTRGLGLQQTISSSGTESRPGTNSEGGGLRVTAQPQGEGNAPRAPSIALSDVSLRTVGSRWRIRSKNGDKGSENKPRTPSSNGDVPTLNPGPEREFTPLTTSLPDTQLDFINQVSFSTRGSVLLGGRKAVNARSVSKPASERVAAAVESRKAATEPSNTVVEQLKTAPEPLRTAPELPKAVPEPSNTVIDPPNTVPEPSNTMVEPQKSVLEPPNPAPEPPRTAPEPLRTAPNLSKVSLEPPRTALEPSLLAVLPEEIAKESLKVRSMYEEDVITDWRDGNPINHPLPLAEEYEGPSNDTFKVQLRPRPQTARAPSANRYSVLRREHELAGGIEDWEDICGEDVDRYGFIVKTSETPEPRAPQRVSTSLQLASQAPRKQRGFGLQSPAKNTAAKSLRTQNTTASQRSVSSPLRTLANRLPGNQDRRWMDEAGDMLTLPHGLADITEVDERTTAAEATKKREWARSEKWRRMAKLVNPGPDGEGMEFEFDVAHPKLIDRTWKGIPDVWRATAWRCFLNASAKKVEGSPTEASLVKAFQRLVGEGSADDVQIDMDVPRTINSHIMFRKRYRGGQRLLFRVLHCLALYFPDTGYVQGMASLAATLLCYYDEEKTFIMCVRLWTLRGLDKLYAHGFAGLMSALDEFQVDWMRGHDVSRQLDELDIGPTAYGTRWYLTLFNYSIPFASQLRVWDVFMLLGDLDPSVPATRKRPFQNGLDVLHACSCALIDGTREILLDSDFDNAMKVLTSWVPIKDEALFMRVARAEWKIHQRRRRAR